MKVWITGMQGMLGHAVTKVAQELGHAVTPTTHEDCAIDDPIQVAETMQKARPNVIINCAGATGKRDIFDMVLSNSFGPHVLSKVAKGSGARLVHVSTDCVFAGDGEEQHDVADLPNPKDPYGRTKLAGEPSEPHVLVVRTSFVGVSGGLCKWLIVQNGGQVDGWENYRWNGTTVNAFAQVLV